MRLKLFMLALKVPFLNEWLMNRVTKKFLARHKK